jgi:aspartyl-tRNA(Asn)/glutamyl-tRNA(Gln) amidotransferase subunit B
VSEPELRSAAEVYAYALKLRQLLRYLRVNSGDLEKGVFRVEPNISIRPAGSEQFGTRTEVKNLNSFRALFAATEYELARQERLLERHEQVVQETRGWHEGRRETFSQRSKEEAEDYRYFPEPDLPPLEIDAVWVGEVRAELPELPDEKMHRYVADFGLSAYDASVLTEEWAVAEWFEAAVSAGGEPGTVANWISNTLFALMNESGQTIGEILIQPDQLVELVALVEDGTISQNTGKEVLAEMFQSGEGAPAIVERQGLAQISDEAALSAIVADVLAANPEQVSAFREGKRSLQGWFIGQVMRETQGKANPQLVSRLVAEQLADWPGR